MSTRNPTDWPAIRDIVRRGQETLARIWLAGKHQERLEYAKKALSSVSHCRDMSPPQTLGELCLELMPVLERHCWVTPDGLGVIDGQYFYPGRVAQKKALRRAMYHRNTTVTK